jgi:hypothetical protein
MFDSTGKRRQKKRWLEAGGARQIRSGFVEI